MNNTEKIISPVAVNCLREALIHIYWYKKDLKNFLNQVISNKYLIPQLNWDDVKRNIVDQLIHHLSSNQKKYKDDIIFLMAEVCKMTDFSHLALLDDGEKKAIKARAAVDALAVHINPHIDVEAEKEKINERRQKAQDKAQNLQSFNNKLDELKMDFYSLYSAENPQARGYRLEKIIIELFELHDIDSKASFKISGEQIDGAFTFENNDYLFEGKWQKELISLQDLDFFDGKLSRKLDNTLGLFCAINGYSPSAISQYSRNRSKMILMDGEDIVAVLERRLGLPFLLQKKRKHASQTGNIYLKASDILKSADY